MVSRGGLWLNERRFHSPDSVYQDLEGGEGRRHCLVRYVIPGRSHSSFGHHASTFSLPRKGTPVPYRSSLCLESTFRPVLSGGSVIGITVYLHHSTC